MGCILIMNKYELLLRISMLGKGKLKIFKKMAQLFPTGLPSNLKDVPLTLKQCELSDEQKKQFFAVPEPFVESVLSWLTNINQKNSITVYCDVDYPPLLKQMSSPPALLFISGNAQLLHSPQIAMVGSREFSEYGAQWGRYFAGELTINGLTVTSGLALGIDAICHRGALEVSGGTIAVLGSGLANITPRANLKLANDILANNGTIVSEFFPFEAARPEYFPRRNRIISGLSLGTFVVEASRKSGSLITARYAIEQNRDVFALPGEINNENCDGTHWLIKQGAYLVTKPTDILEHYSNYLSNVNRQLDAVSDSDVPVLYPEIFAVIHHQPVSVDIIAERVNLSIPEIVTKLLDMEMNGLIKTVSGGYIRNRVI